MPIPLLTVLLAAVPVEAASQQRFDPLTFFAGHTEGTGDLKIVMRGARSMMVHGDGSIEADGTLVLDQLVEQADKPPRRREWRIRQTTPGHYAGTLSDAVGPVAVDALGERLHLTFAMKGGLAVEQWLTLAADGRSAQNVMRVRKLGVVVAQLNETIRRTGP